MNISDRMNETFARQAGNLLANALFHAKETLTDYEKFLVCFAAGVPVGVKPGEAPGTVTLVTCHKCAVIKINGRWEVRMLEKPEKDL